MTVRKPEPPSTGRGERLFRQNLDLIGRIAVFTARAAGLSPQDTEDFRQEYLACLMEDGYRSLESFKGRATLTTFLISVARRRMVDFRAGDAGRYRPTVVARRLGPVAVELEKLCVLKRMGREEAVATLHSRLDGNVSEKKLHALAGLLPHRDRRRFEGDEHLAGMPGGRGDPEAVVRSHEAREGYRRLLKALRQGLELLDPLERVLVLLTLLESERVSNLARSLGEDRRRLYTVRTGALERLRAHLEREGFDREVVGLFEDLE